MIDSLARIITIGRITLTESVRQKVLNILVVFAIILVGASVSISQVEMPSLDSAGLFDAQIKFVKNAGCGVMEVFGFCIAVLSTAQLIPQELHNRTIYTILAKPVRRSEFLLGKFLGVVLLLALCTALMSLAFALTLYWQELRGIQEAVSTWGSTPTWRSNPGIMDAYNRDVAQIIHQVRDPQLIEAILLIFTKLVMTAGIAMLISTFSTSSIFTIVTTFMIYLIGHMERTARDIWLTHGAESTIWQSGLVGLISMLIPDMNSFTIISEIQSGNRVPWSHALTLMGYADVYLVVILAVSIVAFNYREI